MNVDLATVDYVSKYLDHLNRVEDNKNALAPLKMSILYSQRNQSNKIKSDSIEKHCQYCLTPWKHGNLSVKTLPKRLDTNKKNQNAANLSFILAVKCLYCLKTTNSMFNKSKILENKSTKKPSESSILVENINATSKCVKEKLNTTEKKKKKKKKIPYAGLNPLIFKNKVFSKKIV